MPAHQPGGWIPLFRDIAGGSRGNRTAWIKNRVRSHGSLVHMVASFLGFLLLSSGKINIDTTHTEIYPSRMVPQRLYHRNKHHADNDHPQTPHGKQQTHIGNFVSPKSSNPTIHQAPPSPQSPRALSPQTQTQYSFHLSNRSHNKTGTLAQLVARKSHSM